MTAVRQLNVKYSPQRQHPLTPFSCSAPASPLSSVPQLNPSLRDLISGALNVQFVLKQTPIATFKTFITHLKQIFRFAFIKFNAEIFLQQFIHL